MPPKGPQPARPLYKHAREYYKAAYRAHLIANTTWTSAQRNGTLAWMWKHASDAEKQRSEDLRANNSQALPAIDGTTVPDEPKGKDDPAPTVADEDEELDADAGAAAGNNDDQVAGVEPPTKKQRINTTSFPHWPVPATTDYSFVFPEVSGIATGDIEDEDERKAQEAKDRDEDKDNDEEGDGEKKKKLEKFLTAGFFHPEEEESRWHGAHMLGQGANGRVGLWVRANEQNTIEERMAARDVMLQPGAWISPVTWRDQLPREIAVHRRLHARNGYDHHIHRYYAHRISMHQRVYRVFNELCDLDNLRQALEYYMRQWYSRNVTFRWQEAHPGLLAAVKKNDAKEAEKLHREAWAKFMKDPRYEAWANEQKSEPSDTGESGAAEDDAAEDGAAEADAGAAGAEGAGAEVHPDFEELSNLQGIMNFAQAKLPEEPKDVIPERFVWTVFDQLVDAFTILETGGEVPENDDMKWKEIVHNDVHMLNIFMKKADGANGTPLPDQKGFVQYNAHEYPSVVLSDFDRAFFDLQDEDDIYADNPSHYMWGPTPLINPFIGGRYPPETYWNFEGHATGEAFHKLDTKTNVWSIGLIIWALVMNLPARHVLLEMPFLDHDGTKGRHLIDGTPYTAEDLKNLLTGNTPYEASRRYSDELKATVRRCLAYTPEDRPTLQALRETTRKHLEPRKTTRDGSSRSNSEDTVIIKIPETLQQFNVGANFNVPAPVGGKKGKGKSKGKGKRKRNSH